MGKKWTYEDPKGDHHMLDYILVNSKWINSVKNAEPYSSFASVGSDHRVVTMDVRLSLRVTKAPTKKPNYDWRLLRQDQELQQQYTIEQKNKFEELYDESASATEQYAAFLTSNEHAASKILPVVKHSNNEKVIQARKDIQTLTKRYSNTISIRKTKELRKKLQDAKANLQEVYKELDEERLMEQIANTETAFQGNDTRNAWKIVNTITNRKQAPSGKLSRKTPEERKKQWYNHFKNLLGTPSDDTSDTTEIRTVLKDLEIDDSEFTKEEYEKAKKQVKEGKAPGEDNLMPEVVKRCDIDDILLLFSNKILMEGRKPDQLSILDITPIPKSGDLSNTGNYRGISLASLATKLVDRMILNRIRPKIDPHLRNNQNGFRPGRSTITQVPCTKKNY